MHGKGTRDGSKSMSRMRLGTWHCLNCSWPEPWYHGHRDFPVFWCPWCLPAWEGWSEDRATVPRRGYG